MWKGKIVAHAVLLPSFEPSVKTGTWVLYVCRVSLYLLWYIQSGVLVFADSAWISNNTEGWCLVHGAVLGSVHVDSLVRFGFTWCISELMRLCIGGMVFVCFRFCLGCCTSSRCIPRYVGLVGLVSSLVTYCRASCCRRNCSGGSLARICKLGIGDVR